MLKRYIKIVELLMLILLVFSGCTREKVDTSKLNLVTSFYPMYVATANIVDGVEDVELKNLTATTTGCLHDYQLTTSNMITLSTADALIINGGGMETFITKAVESYGDLKVIDASEGILEHHDEEKHLNVNGEQNAHSHEHGENAHIWVSLSMYIKQVENIRNELVEIDSKNANKYIENADKYIKELVALKEKMNESLNGIENKKIVTFHEAFEFFAEEFNLDIVAVIEREPGTYPSARDVASIIDLVRENEVNAIFVEPQYSRTAADTIARETGVEVYILDPIVTGELDKNAYTKLMNENLETLLEALS